MKILVKILEKKLWFKSFIYKFFLRFQPAVLDGNFFRGKNLILHAPLKINGAGEVFFDDNVIVGFPLAARYGSGEVLVQARTENSVVRIGRNVHFSNNVSIIATDNIIIGSDTLLGELTTIVDSDFHEINPLQRRKSAGISSPVVIGNNVWIGSRVFIQKGVTIGDNSIITPMSVVTRNIPANCIAGGVPAKFIKNIEF